VPNLGEQSVMQNDIPKIGYFQKRKLLSFYKNFVGNADLAFVFGDQTGNLTQLLTLIGAKTICIQPISEYFPILADRFTKNKNCILLKEDVGAFQTEFFYNGIYERHILPFSSNLSAEDNQEYIKITTLDDLILNYGKPTFCYINGEGYEAEVLKGLNQPIQTIVLTFFSFTQEKTAAILRRLISLGQYEFNWKLLHESSLKSKTWLSPKALHHSMFEFSDAPFSGELFARIKIAEDEI
jgi:FkbM family methyltransferase